MAVGAIVIGAAAQALAWWLVAAGREVWRVVPPVFATCGVLALAVGDATLVGNPALGEAASGAVTSLAIGLGAGVGLYVGTLAFTSVAARWAPFRRHTATSYGRARTVALPVALALTTVAVVGEELFWRALVQTELRATFGDAATAAVATAGLYVVANLPSRSLPIAAAAIVGGVLWAALAPLTGSILAPAASHLAWTWLMLAVPPAAGREMMGP
jgi:membrane protease YdiL (CAAX protease family)